MSLWIALLAIGGGICLMLCVVTCCVVRCFRPENSRGPAWVSSKDGKAQLVKSLWRTEGENVPGDKNWLRKGDGTPVPAATIPISLS